MTIFWLYLIHLVTLSLITTNLNYILTSLFHISQVVLDRSGIYLATSCTDKSLSVYDYYSGECMATMCGHSELATGLRFTNDCRRLISASGDGCIFVWRVPHDMVVTMHARLSQQAMRQGKQLEQEVFSDSSTFDFYDGINNTVDTNYR